MCGGKALSYAINGHTCKLFDRRSLKSDKDLSYGTGRSYAWKRLLNQ